MDSIELACSSSAFANTSLLDAIEHIGRIGYSAIEIRAGHEAPYQDKPSQDNGPIIDEHYLRTVKERLECSNMAVSNIAVGSHTAGRSGKESHLAASNSHDDPWQGDSYREYIERCVRIAQYLNCNSVTVCPGTALYTPETPINERSYLIEGINGVTKFARGLGISIGVSYGPGLTLKDAADVRALILKCRGLKIAFHVARSHLSCETPCLIATNNKHHIKHIHLADAGAGERAYLAPGEGEIEWISFFKTLRWIGYKGFVTVDLASFKDMPDLAAIRAYHYLSNIMNALSLKRKNVA